MSVDQCLGNREAKPETSKTASDLSLSLFENVKDLIDLFRLYANPGVDDASFNFVRCRVKSLDQSLGNREAKPQTSKTGNYLSLSLFENLKDLNDLFRL